MSLLRYRAMDASAESIRSDFSPALARDWFVSEYSCDSAALLNELASQAKVAAGTASRPPATTAIETASNGVIRRTTAARARGRRFANSGKVRLMVGLERRPET